MDSEQLRDLACRLEAAERRSKHLRRLLELGQALTAEATKEDWTRSVAREVVHASRAPWAAFCLTGREVDRIFMQRRHASEPLVTIRPAGYLRRSAGDSWRGSLPARLRGERFGLPADACWYLPVRVHNSVRGGIVLPEFASATQNCGDSSELLQLLAHQVSLAAELAELHGDVVQAATFDRMTGVLNRGAWLERASERLQLINAQNGSAAVVLFDLDHFKEVNDTLGHAEGDDYLVATAHAARSVLRGEDLVARFGGDEFVVWLENLEPSTLGTVIERLMVRVSAVAGGVQCKLRSDAPQLGISVGVAETQSNSTVTLDQLLECADLALYESKANGRGTWRYSRKGEQARAS